MFDAQYTKHAEKRMKQRGIRSSDINLILEHGEEIDGDGVLMTNKRAENLIQAFKKKIATIERLRNTKVVVDGDTIVSCYACRKSEPRRMKKLTRRH